MRYLPRFLAVALLFGVAHNVKAAEGLDELFDKWEHVQRTTRSLVVEFSLSEKDRTFNTTTHRKGVFKLLRTPEGDIVASHEVWVVKPGVAKEVVFKGLLAGGSLYLLKDEFREAMKVAPKDGKILESLRVYFNPLISLLDRKQARRHYNLSIVKADSCYVYLKLSPTPDEMVPCLFGGKGHTFNEGRVVLMNEVNGKIPRGMPKQIWYSDAPGNEWTFEIQSWKWNTDAPKVEEFTPPEKRAGWEVMEAAKVWKNVWGLP